MFVNYVIVIMFCHIYTSMYVLFQITTFHAEGSTHTETKEIARLSKPGINEHHQGSWTGDQLVIPPLPPSFLRGCAIIDIRYWLKVIIPSLKSTIVH